MDLDLETAVTEVRRQFKLFALIVAACVAASVIMALVSRPVYRSEVVVAPADEDSLGGLGNRLGGLASLAGGMLGGTKNWSRALAVLRSRHLIEELVTRQNLIPVLFAPQHSSLPGVDGKSTGRAPTMGDAVKLFQGRILQVREDPKGDLATVRVEWFDPHLAAEWANELVALADEQERVNALTDAQKAVQALQTRLQSADGVELRSAIAKLIEEQLQAELVAGVRAEFQYRVIDRAEPADLNKRVQPTRTTMVLAGTLAGLLLAVMVVLTRAQLARKRLPERRPGG